MIDFKKIKIFGKKGLSDAKIFAGNNSSELFMITGLVTLLTSEVLTVIATTKAVKSVEEEKHKVNRIKLTRKEVVKVTWKHYIGPVVTSAAGVGCIIYGNRIGAKKTAALATALGMSQSMLADYKQKTLETIGSDKEKLITEKVANEKINQAGALDEVTLTGHGEVLFYDAMTGHIIKSSRSALREAVIKINERLLDEMYMEYSEFCYEANFDGGYLAGVTGWSVTDGLIKLDLSNAGVSEKGEPYIIIDFLVKPNGQYRNR